MAFPAYAASETHQIRYTPGPGFAAGATLFFVKMPVADYQRYLFQFSGLAQNLGFNQSGTDLYVRMS